jgi:hypothetical protein
MCCVIEVVLWYIPFVLWCVCVVLWYVIQDLEFVDGKAPDSFGSGNSGNMAEVGIDVL